MLALFPEIAACAQAGDLEKLAVMVRQYFAPEEAAKPTLDAYALVTNFGIPVRSEFLDYHAALAVGDAKGDIRASMVVSKSVSREEQVFTLCHLLGHFIIHIQPALSRGEWKSSGFKEQLSPLSRYAMSDGLSGMSAHEFASEDLADRFAGALLMPAAMLRRAMGKLQDPSKVAHVFGVTKEAVERRLDDLGDKKSDEIVLRVGAFGDKTSIQTLEAQASAGSLDSERLEVPASQLIRDVSHRVPKPSRAVAAHSYSDAAQTESKSRPSGEEPAELKGMARIRELARKLDKFGDKSK